MGGTELFKLFGTIGLNGMEEFNSDLDNASARGASFASNLGKALTTVGKVAGVAIAAAGTAFVGLIKGSVDSYQTYEQLVGGAQLMFGEAYDFVADKAKNAYATVGLSANAYYEQVNGFAVGLKTALKGDEQAAAVLADKIITAEADIVAATGASQESVQSAFNGIMKGNYTMLDNLKLGITPTKQGMQDLIKQVNAWNKANGKATKYNINNMADCQAALVDYIEMQGISGYAAEEGASTLEGSLARMSSAWANFLTYAGDETADMEAVINGLVESIIGYSGQLVKRISIIAPRLIEGLVQLINSISPEIPTLIQSLLPAIIEGAISIVSNLVISIPSILKSLWNAIVQSAKTVWSQISEALGLGKLKEKFTDFAEYAKEKFEPVLEKCRSLFSRIKIAIEPLTTKISNFIEKIKTYVTSGEAANDATDALKQAIDWLAGALEWVLEKLDSFITWCQENPETIETIAIIIGSVAAAIVLVNTAIAAWNAISAIATVATTAFGAAVNFLTSPITLVIAAIAAIIAIVVLCIKHWDEIKEAAANAWEVIKNAWNVAAEWFDTNIIQPIVSFFTNLWNSITTAATNAWTAISNAASSVWEAIKGVWDAVTSWFETNITEPLKSIFESVWTSIQNTFAGIVSFFEGIWEKIKGTFTELGIMIGDAVSGAVKGAVNTVLGWVENAINKAIGLINSVIDIINKIPGVELGHIGTVSFNKLAKGGVLEKGEIGVLEGSGAEAVVPLENNRKWISAVAEDMNQTFGNNFLSSQTDSKLDRVITLMESIVGDMPETFKDAFEAMRLKVNDREFARMVKAVENA